MQNERVAVEFFVSASKSSLDCYFTLPLKDGEDWFCVLSIPDLVRSQRFYGTSHLEAILNTINFVSSFVASAPPLLRQKLSASETDTLSVRYDYSA